MKSSSKQSLNDICREFDALVESQRNMTNYKRKSSSFFLDLFGLQAKARLDSYRKILNLPKDQYFAVTNALIAIEAYGKGEIGMEIYNRNKTVYFVSKKLNSILERSF